jgi:hypothetical protein
VFSGSEDWVRGVIYIGPVDTITKDDSPIDEYVSFSVGFPGDGGKQAATM